MGNQPLVSGEKTYPSGNYYKGQFRGAKREGQGMLIWADGAMKYEGEWINDEMHGHGTLSFPNGNVYVGQFSRGNPFGQGTLTTINGECFEGDFAYQGRAHYASPPVGKYIFHGTARDLKGKSEPIRYIGPCSLHWSDGFVTFPGMPENSVMPALPYAILAASETAKEGQKLFNEALSNGEAPPVAAVVGRPPVAYGVDDPSLRPHHPDDHATYQILDPRLYVPFIGAPTNFNAGKQRAIREAAAQSSASGEVVAQAVPVPSGKSRAAVF